MISSRWDQCGIWGLFQAEAGLPLFLPPLVLFIGQQSIIVLLKSWTQQRCIDG